MLEYKVGDYIEVGMGDSPYDEDGWSYYFQMDIPDVTEEEIVDLFGKEGNVLYVQVDNDPFAVKASDGMTYSKWLE